MLQKKIVKKLLERLQQRLDSRWNEKKNIYLERLGGGAIGQDTVSAPKKSWKISFQAKI